MATELNGACPDCPRNFDLEGIVYERLYHFVSAKYGLQNIRKKRVKASRINELNDPFELYACKMSSASDRRRFEYLKSEFDKRKAIICFSRDKHNPVMWSHYADRHRGICLGFDVDKSMLIDVRYTPSRLDVTGLDDEGLFGAVVATKFSHWKYEREVRVFCDRGGDGLHFEGFNNHLVLREIIIGEQSLVSRRQINMRVSRYGYKIDCYKARKAFNTFRVVRNRNQSLWC